MTEEWYEYSSLSDEITKIQVVRYTDKHAWELVDWREEPFRWHRHCNGGDLYVAGVVQTYEEALARLRAFNEKRLHEAERDLAYLRQEEARLNKLSLAMEVFNDD